MKVLFTPIFLIAALSMSGCELTLDDKEKLDNAATDLQQLADQIIITYPAKDSEVSDSIVTVRADIPASAQAQEIRLLVDGIEIAKDSDGAPWEIQWPAYLFADGDKHTLLLKAITGEGNEVRNNEQFQLIVSEQANKALMFEEGVDGKSIQDQGSLTFTFTEFEGALGYEILIDGDYDNLLVSNTAEIELNNLNVGTHTVQYRVLHGRLNSTPFSEVITFEVLPASLPVINEPLVGVSIDGYQVTLSWEAVVEGDNYEILWGTRDNLQSVGTTQDSSYVISGVTLGNYEYALIRTNPLGQRSEVSDSISVDVGTFRTQLGGSQNDYAKQIIASKQGGYLIRGTTNSHDVSETLKGYDDWIIHLDDRGSVVKEFLSIAEGRDRFNDIFEANDGSIYLTGTNWVSNEAVIVKLNDNLEQLWEKIYRPADVTERYDFINILEWNDKLYISSAQWKTTANRTSRDALFIHEFNSENGEITSGIPLPFIPDILLGNANKLFATTSNNLIISGYGYPLDIEVNMWAPGGAFILSIDSDFNTLFSWNTVGNYDFMNATHAIELLSGKVAIVGQNDRGYPAVSIINADGTRYRSYNGTDNYFWNGTIMKSITGGFYGLFKDQGLYSDPYPIQIIEFDESAVPVNTKYLVNESERTEEQDMVLNSDGSLTILLTTTAANIADIVIKQIPFER